MIPYIILGIYVPKRWKTFVIGRSITKITSDYGLKPLKDPIHGPQTWVPWYDLDLHAEVKKRTPRNPKGEDWHQDGDLDLGSKMDHALVLWSNIDPTQIEYKGTIYQPRPYEIVLFRNLAGKHRRPPTAPRNRFIFRQRVEVPTHMELP